jgi:hypothetical protein
MQEPGASDQSAIVLASSSSDVAEQKFVEHIASA